MTFKSLFDGRMKTLLTLSVVLNVLLIGGFGGHIYKRWSSHPWHAVKQELSPETRNVIGRTFQSAFREIKPLGDEARKARADLVRILSADEFDEAAFDKAAEKISGVRSEMVAIKIQATKDAALQLSVEERRKMADRMAKMVGGGHERRVKRHRRPKAMGVRPDRKPRNLSEK